MTEPSGFEQGFNWFTDRHFAIWPLSLFRLTPNERFGPLRVLVLGWITATAAVLLVTILRWWTDRAIDGFATVGISIIALLLSWVWFSLAALAWNCRAARLGLEAQRRV
jgi:hypothetical protein